MAVPSAVLRQRERLENELGINKPAEAPPADPALTLVPPVVAESTPVVPATPAADEATALRAQLATLQHTLDTQDGRASVSMRELSAAKERETLLATQVRALEDAVASMQTQVETAEAKAAARSAEHALPSLDDPGDLTEKEVAEFGSDSVKFVQKLSKKELLAYINPLVTRLGAMEKMLARLSDLDKIPQLETAVKTTAAEAQRVKEEEFFRKEVLAYFADFEKARDTQEWKDYISTDIPGRGIKIGHLLHQYRLAHDALGIRSIIQSYYDDRKAKPSLSALAVPSKSATEGTPVTKPRMKASEYQTNLRSFTSRRMDKTAWETFKKDFETALAEDRVEMDARL